jgi:hypothetical protein
MLALTRFRPYLPVAAWLFALLLLTNCALRLLNATPVFGWLPKVTAGAGYTEDNRQRVAAACDEYQKGQVAPDEPLCAIVGLSNVREAVSLKVVSAEAKVTCRYMALGAAGVGMPTLKQQASILHASELRPDLVLVGLGPHQMVDARPKPGKHQQGVLAPLRQGDFRNAALAVRDWLWFYDRRQDVSLTTEAALLDVRADLFRRFGVRLQELESNHRSPWREMIRSIFAEHFSEATLKEEEQFFADLGAYDRQTYANSPKAAAALVEMVRDLRQRGSVVVIVLMPENSRLRKRMPPDINDTVTGPLRAAFGEDAPQVIDLRDAVEDEGFVDLTHLNQVGNQRCSRLIGTRVPDLLPRHAPLMKQAGGQ